MKLVSSSNPLKQPMTFRQKIAVVLYAAFFLTSVWATGESISRSTDLPWFFCFMMGFAALAGASFCLAIIKRSFRPQNRGKGLFFIGLIGFLFLWSVTFISNTHNLFYVGTIHDQRKKELNEVRNALESIKANSLNSVEGAKGKFIDQISSEVKNMKAEIMNLGDLGDGKQAREIIARLEELLDGRVGILDPASRSFTDLKAHADQMERVILEMRDAKLLTLQEQTRLLNEILQSPRYQNIISNLENTQANYEDISTKEAVKILREAYAFNKICTDQVNSLFDKLPFLKQYAEWSPKDIPVTAAVPESIEMENIASTWQNFLQGKYEGWYFWLSIMWALTIEIACFILFYYGVLPGRDDEYSYS